MPCHFTDRKNSFSRIGVELPRSTMCNWAMKVAQACEIRMRYIQAQILKGPVINIYMKELAKLMNSFMICCGQTKVKYQGGPWPLVKNDSSIERARPVKKLYVGVQGGGGPPGKPIILFQYHPTRAGDVASKLLDGYQGIVQTDGYAGYNFLDMIIGMIHVACWIHDRRKFTEKLQMFSRLAG